MNFFQQQKLVISTLTPVHIGTGEDYEPGNYIIDQSYLHAFDPSILANKLTDLQAQQLLAIVEKDPINEQALIKLQQFFKQNSVLAKEIASYKVPVSKELEQFYEKRLGHVVQHERNNRNGRHKKVANKLEIERTCQNHHNNQYYIPGSSLKGAIRTAIVDKLNRKTFLNRDEQRNKKTSAVIQKEALHYHQVSDDPLKLLKLSDTVFKQEKQNDLPQSAIHFCVNRKRKPAKKSSMAEDKGLYQILECISKNQYREIKTDIRIFEDKDNKLQGLGVNSIEKIAQLCNCYYLPILLKELLQLKVLNMLPPAWDQMMQTLLEGTLSKQLQQGRAFLLKIGKHGGADTKTLNEIRNIYIPQLKKSLPEPTTYWLAANDEKSSADLLPFGWILLENADAPELTELKTYMQEHTQHIRQQVKADKEKQQIENELKKQREKEQQLHIEEEKQQEIMEQKKQNLLASLSEEQRKIKQLELLLEEKTAQNDKTPGGELSILINELLNDTTVLLWDSDIKNQLADQLEAAFNFIGWGNKKKKPARVEKVSRLRS